MKQKVYYGSLTTILLALVITVLPHSVLAQQSSNVVIDRIDKSESDSLIVQNSTSYVSGQSADSSGVRTYELFGAVYQNETKDSETPSETNYLESLRIPSTSTVSSNWPRDTQTAVVEVTSATGRIWMDRNLGATRRATSPVDEQAYGDLYQWGRPADGHGIRNSPTTTTLSNSDQPGHGNFITVDRNPRDWRTPQNFILWQGVDGINNPCPAGFRVPTLDEWRAEMDSWSSRDAVGAFNSALKLPLAGKRSSMERLPDDDFDDIYPSVGSRGYYWSSRVFGSRSGLLNFDISSLWMERVRRAN